MNIRQAVFACTTPYQIMGAISICLADKLDADIIIFGMFQDYETVAERIRNSGVFSGVYVVAPEKYRKPGISGAGMQMLRAKAVVGNFLPEDVGYQTYYSSSRAHIKNILLHELIRRNPELKIAIYDDGMGTYASDSHVLNTSSLRKKAEKLMGWELYTPERIIFEVYEPCLFETPRDLTSCQVYQMPKPDMLGAAGEIIKNIFEVAPEDQIQERVILFDPLRGLDAQRDKKLEEIDKCYQMVVESFGYENVILKPHPRSTKSTGAGVKIYKKTGIPMEILYAGMDDLNERVLVTYASSAVYTPKMLFGVEPVVFNLFRITDGGSSEWQSQHNKFSSLYIDKNRISAPENMTELSMAINKLISYNKELERA